MSLNAARAILIAWGLCLIFPPTELMAGTLTSPVEQADEHFKLSTSTVTTGTVLEKWLDVERKLDGERQVLKICEEARASCRSQAALQLLAIVDGARTLEGRARLGDVNRAINLKIKPMTDLALYGVEDVWSPPLVTLAKGAGDCEDYAIAKFVALQAAGVSADDLRIVILRDDIREEDHAVVAARRPKSSRKTLRRFDFAMRRSTRVSRCRSVARRCLTSALANRWMQCIVVHK